MRPLLLAWSGGKDAAWALHRLRQSGEWQPVGLLSTVTDGYERIAMHGIRRSVLHAQAAALGLPVIEARIGPDADNTSYEQSFASALHVAQARWPGIAHIAFGDLFLADIKAWRDALCARLGWQPVYPLFPADTAALAREMLAAGLRATLCCVDGSRLSAAFVGRAFDAALLAELPAAVDPCGENGEFHTCVYAGPMFARPLRLVHGETVLRDARFAYVDLIPC